MSEDALIFTVLTTGGVLIATLLVRLWRTAIQHRTIREAISRDNPAVTALLDGIADTPGAPPSDDRTGMVLVALAIALLGFGLIQGDLDDIRTLGGAALFPALVGGALLLRHYYAQRRI